MLVKDLLKHQRQFAPIGRIRAGITDGKRPMTIDTYRFTSASEEAVEAAAAASVAGMATSSPSGASASGDFR